MYVCQICKKVVSARTKAHRIPVETRHRQYPFRPKVNRIVRDGKIQYKDDPGGEGYEIVQEIIACPDCAAQFGQHVEQP